MEADLFHFLHFFWDLSILKVEPTSILQDPLEVSSLTVTKGASFA